jgi:hypothetical protein
MLVRYVAGEWLMADVVQSFLAAASSIPPIARFVGRRCMRRACGGHIPSHVSDVVFQPTAEFLTTHFRFAPPLRRDGWPKDFAERDNPELGNVIASKVVPPLQITRSYYHARLDDGVVYWIHVDESANRGVLFELG